MTATQATPPRGQGQAAVPVGGDRAWPNNKPTHRATSATWHHWCEGRRRDLPRCRWAAAGPGRTTRRRTEPHVSTPSAAGVKGAGGICRGAGGRWQGLAGLRGAAPSEARLPSLAGGRALRRPKHPWAHKTARPHRGRAAQSASEAHRRTTTMSGSPRPLSWRTLEIPSLAATSFAVPSMRGSS